MSKYLIDGSTLTGIADAIRANTGSYAPVMTTEMAEKIAAMGMHFAGVTNIGTLPQGVSTSLRIAFATPGIYCIIYAVYSIATDSSPARQRIYESAENGTTLTAVKDVTVIGSEQQQHVSPAFRFVRAEAEDAEARLDGFAAGTYSLTDIKYNHAVVMVFGPDDVTFPN